MKNGVKARYPLLLFIIAMLLCGVLFFIMFDFPEQKISRADEYEVTAYNISAVVHEDNSLSITEEIDVDFNLKSHGIYRYIPLNSTVNFESGGKAYSKRYHIQISDVKCSHDCAYEIDSGNYVLRIGSASHYANDSEKYVISYVAHLGNDKISEFDQFYYNLVGDGWDTTISNLSLSISFEKPISDRKIYFYTSTQTYEAEIINNQVVFTYQKLQPFQPLTARVELENGYFDFPPISYTQDIILLSIALAAVITFIILALTMGRKNKIVEVVEFTPPDDLTPADAGYLIDRQIDNGEISALVVYWANKGYLKIEEEGDKTTLVKLKNADQNMKNYEKNIFQALFAGGERFDLSSTNIPLGSAITSAKVEIKNQNEKYFSKTLSTLKMLPIVIYSLLISVNYFLLSRALNLTNFGFTGTIFSFLLTFIGLYFLHYAITKKLNLSKISFALTLLSGIAITASVLIFGGLTFFDEITSPLYTTISLPILALPLVIISLLLDDKIDDEKHSFGRLLGLRKFILLAEKDRLKVLGEQNPMLFYEILPYAYTLGISGVWIDKFKDIEIQPAPYYSSGADGIATIIVIDRLMLSMSAFNAMTLRSLPTPKRGGFGGWGNGGGFGGGFGGGHAGGGFGGGGGGRW